MQLEVTTSTLLLVDFQARLMPAIADHAAVLANAVRLARAAALLGVPALATEENPAGLGGTVPELAGLVPRIVAKRFFDATREPELAPILAALTPCVVVAGCEAHVCVLQTVLGLLARGHAVALVADAIGSRAPASRTAALDRAARAGAVLLTTEMVLFEWVATCDHPRFNAILELVR